jgi:Flp pilus assembly pilin Flp
MRRIITALWVDESGARAIDGAMTAALAAAAVIAAATAAGVSLDGLYRKIVEIALGALALIAG